jgi:hypothetical protein
VPDLNGSLVAELVELEVVEMLPVISAAYKQSSDSRKANKKKRK